LLDQSTAHRLTSGDVPGLRDDLLGGFVTPNGLSVGAQLSASDQDVLTRLDLNPTFVGLERRMVTAAIEGQIGELIEEQTFARIGARDDNGPANDGTGTWVIRLDRDQVRLGGGG
jgi:hypothetical protein